MDAFCLCSGAFHNKIHVWEAAFNLIPRFHGEASDVLFLEFLHQLLILSGIDHASFRALTGTKWQGPSVQLAETFTRNAELFNHFGLRRDRHVGDPESPVIKECLGCPLLTLQEMLKVKGAISSGIQLRDHHPRPPRLTKVLKRMVSGRK